MIEYVENKEIIARRIAHIFKTGDVVNLGIGLSDPRGPTSFPSEVTVVLQSENGMLGLGPFPRSGRKTPT